MGPWKRWNSLPKTRVNGLGVLSSSPGQQPLECCSCHLKECTILLPSFAWYLLNVPVQLLQFWLHAQGTLPPVHPGEGLV